jgi:glucose-1-phosphate adenylyltransferase
MGDGDEADNETRPDIYREGLVTLGEGTVIPDNIIIGKNVMINGVTTDKDYNEGRLESGRTLDKAGEQA